MLAGLMLGGLVVLRILWGFVGTKYARFSSFALHPKDLLHYMKNVMNGNKQTWNGHNPASSWATLIMLFSTIMLALTGILMSSGYKERFEDVHEFFANAFLVTVLFHIAGVLLHAFRYQDGIALTMVHGKKELSDDHTPIPKSKPLASLLLLVLMAAFGASLLKNYNQTTNELNLFGKTLTLGEDEHEDQKNKHEEEDDD